MELGLDGKVAIVTGGSEGIGKAAALRMAGEGANVIIVARRQDVLDAAADEIRTATEGEVLPLSADVTDPRYCGSSGQHCCREIRTCGHPGEQRRHLHGQRV